MVVTLDVSAHVIGSSCVSCIGWDTQIPNSTSGFGSGQEPLNVGSCLTVLPSMDSDCLMVWIQVDV
jgi:hypothetical protein